jgi:hypothetical protein
VGKQKEHKLPSKVAWIFRLANQQNGLCKAKVPSDQSPEEKETVEEHHPSKATCVLGLNKEQAQQTKFASLQVPAGQYKHPKNPSPHLNAETVNTPQRMYMRQKSNSLSRCSPSRMEQFLQQQHHILPVASSVETVRRNSLWTQSSSKSSMLKFI